MTLSLKIRIKLLIEIFIVVFEINRKFKQIKKEKTIKVNSLLLKYFKAGNKGENIVFLHGWGQSKETWSKLTTSFKENVIYALDLPGFGKSNTPSKTLLLKDYAYILNEFFKKIKVNKIILIGHSFGGKVATEFTLRYPQKVDKLVIYSTDLGVKKNIKGNLLDLLVWSLNFPFFKKIIRMYLKLRNKSFNKYEILREIFVIGRKKNNFINRINKIKIKTLLLYGKYDFITSFKEGAAINKLVSNSKLIVLKRSSHLAHMEEEKTFIKEILNFIK